MLESTSELSNVGLHGVQQRGHRPEFKIIVDNHIEMGGGIPSVEN